MLPPWLWGVSLLGCVVGGWRGRALLVRGYLVATFTPLAVIIIFFFIGPEYTQPYLPVLFLWAGHGLVWLVTFVGERRGALRAAVIVPVLMAIGYAGYLVAMQFPSERNVPYHYTQDEGRYDDKQVGMRLRKILPQNAVIMTRSGRIGFYAQRPYVMPPQADMGEIVSYARQQGVTHLVATIQLLNLRPQLEPLFGPILTPGAGIKPPAGFELVHAGQEPGGLPYLVYRISGD